ncbi:ImmA/IrrE family metallo-endopeptidase [Streptomyces bambusae]|uniref:ImmA/IrrE family metallo-endopeptidase n=1 Tax=Streptomyces bambusae TaxID=1550616 RepID=UPI001CFE6A20|nr:ImmA/IrrE family metallo-endopeptidase [Streptomyces bambusae]MCB5168257.1 ImmA/IrrE family metallo-endopeptidase [Streptomyces bambusae]
MRGRPIDVLPLSLPTGGPHGLWVATAARDHIFVEERLVPVHRRQVVLHEIGHVLCDHPASPVMTALDSRALLPSLDPDVVLRVLGREHSSSAAEIEAETIASLIGRHLGDWSSGRLAREVPPEAKDVADRLAALLEAPGRHTP